MKRLLAAALLFTVVSCRTATAPAPAPVTPAPAATPSAATGPCNPGHSLVNAVAWVTTSAEYQANSLQTFAAARRMLDAALADPTWIGATEETANAPAQPPAIILDLDETAIDNGRFEARAIGAGKTYDETMWNDWVAEANADAVPGAAAFLAYARSRGVTPFYITNRDHDPEEPGTLRNLQKLGFPLDPAIDTLLTRGEGEWKGSDKSPRRAHVAANYRVLMLLGDDLNDFTSARDKGREERDAIIRDTADWWGTRWFMIANPMYGSWERPLTGGKGTPCELVQKKIEALER